MATYQIFDFLMSGDIMHSYNYPEEEYYKYLEHFEFVPFEFDGVIKLLHFDLTLNSSSRVCNGRAYNLDYDEIESLLNGKFPPIVAYLTLTLWRNGQPQIKINKDHW